MKKEIFMNEILNLDSLYEINDLQQVKELIKNQPINLAEYCLSLLEKKQYRDLFEFAVENKDYLPNKDSLALSIMNRNYNSTEELIIKDLYKNSNFENVNKEYFSKNKIQTLNDFVDYMQSIRNDFTLEMVNYFNKKRICEGLNRKYFLELLNKSIDEPELMENLKIKLVKKLEQVLQNDYGCNQEMLQGKIDFFAQNFNIIFNDCNMQNLLHKLRISSNDIRHQQVKGDDLSIEELKICIDYICLIDNDEDFNIDTFDVNYKANYNNTNDDWGYDDWDDDDWDDD